MVYGQLRASEVDGRLSASEAYLYLWSRAWEERDKDGGTSPPLPTNPKHSTIESMGQSPHCPRSWSNCIAFNSYARSSDIMQECPGLSVLSLVWSLSTPHVCICHGMVLVRGTRGARAVSLRIMCSSHVVFEGCQANTEKHLTQCEQNISGKKKSRLYTPACATCFS